ncbi:hypothetical protein [Actinomadura gamaensis]|uniref:ATP synthase F subunit n=1 Tax=Actinomadura gamaensis TaxID=1763541 RepID=A0ABV9TUV6_9ACTN
MPVVAVLGERVRIEGYGLAGALVLPAEDAAAVTAAWDALPGEAAIVILTARAAAALGPRRTARPGVLTAVLP